MMLETNGMYGMHSGMRNEGGVCLCVRYLQRWVW